jgi:2-haloacid dehalogenase
VDSFRFDYACFHAFRTAAFRLSFGKCQQGCVYGWLVVPPKRASGRGIANSHEKGDHRCHTRSFQREEEKPLRSSVRHIVFDIGKVLIHYDPELAYLDIIPDPSERRWFLRMSVQVAWNIEQDRGRTWQEAEALLINAHPEKSDHIRAFRKNWNRMVPHAYEDSVEILRGLIANGHDVTMLTNFASDTFREAQGRFPFLAESRGVTVSGDIRMLKPDREIYDHHVTSFDLDPAATLFIDDTMHMSKVPGSWLAGRAFTGANKLGADLKALDLTF